MTQTESQTAEHREARASSLSIGVFGARSIPSTYSGYETFLTTLLPCLAANGHAVTIYCRRNETSGTGPYKGVRRVTLPALPGKQLNTLSHGAVAAVRARLAAHDVVLVVNVANSLFCSFNTLTGQPVLLNTDGQEWLRGKWGRAARSYFRFSARIAERGATGLIADCAAMADVYERDFGAASTVIPYCFPTISFRPEPAVLDRYGVAPDRYYIIAGRLNPENNIDKVVEAYARSSAASPLLVLGAANYASPVQIRLDQLSADDDRIRLLGHVHDRPEFLSLVTLAAAYIHGHSVGGMNPSLVEAMGAGALIAALDTTFNRETVGETGAFFAQDCGDVVDVLRTLEGLSDAERSALRAGAASRVHERFSVDEVVNAYEALLSSAAGGSSRRRLHRTTRWSEA